MIQRSVSLPNKPQEENQKQLQRSEEIEELCEELNEDYNDSDEFINFKGNIESSEYSDHDCELTTLTDQNKYGIVTMNQEQGSDSKRSDVLNKSQSIETQDNLSNQNENIGRVIDKSGRRNVNLLKIPKRSLRYFKDIVTTLIEQQWRFTIAIFIGSFILSWIIFTLLWYLIAYAHGDLLFDENGSSLGEDHKPCIVGVKSLLDVFIFTVETQTTIGFGEKYSTEECPESVFLFVVQIIISIALDGAMIGIVYAKISKPVKYISKFKFSKKAVICTRDDKLCLVFRVCDPGEHQAIHTKINAFVLLDKKTAEGELLIKVRKELQICNSQSPILVWPETICHIIDETSPLHECIQDKDFCKHFEIYISLIGCSPSSGQMTESKTSYLPCEIIWDHYFSNIIIYDWDKQNYFIDYNNFNTIIPIKNN